MIWLIRWLRESSRNRDFYRILRSFVLILLVLYAMWRENQFAGLLIGLLK